MLLIMENVLIVLCNSSNTVTMFFDVLFFYPGGSKQPIGNGF